MRERQPERRWTQHVLRDMHVRVSHRGAILPAEAMHDGPAIDRLTVWIKENCIN